MAQNLYRPVHALPAEVARKIAAGEVIDRPGAVVRELLDNAIDAGATRIRLEITAGGTEEIRVTDNGCGMTKEDLDICWQPHTTSKIQEADDLMTLSTLGFRGEALSSAAAVSILEITSTRDGREAWVLRTTLSPDIENQKEQKITATVLPARLAEGTTVSVKRLFANFPARKLFLKRTAAESAVCRQAFIDKALAWPLCAFTFAADNAVKLAVRGNSSHKERCLEALEPAEPAVFFHQIEGTGKGFSFTAVLGSPEVVRKDRRSLMVFINGRRVSEYSLVQALEYGAEGSFPNGAHPFACLFLTIDSALIDFNIHPAKKEIRFKDPGAVHVAVSSAVRAFYRQSRIAAGAVEEAFKKQPPVQPSFTFPQQNAARSSGRVSAESVPYPDNQPSQSREQASVSAIKSLQSKTGDSNIEAIRQTVSYLLERRKDFADAADFAVADVLPPTDVCQNSDEPVYMGQIFNVFLAAQYRNRFYLIDQHAAHERILFDTLLSNSGENQELLIPYRIELDAPSQDVLLKNAQEELQSAGFRIEQDASLLWNVTAVPMRWTGTEQQLKDDILDACSHGSGRMRHLMATAACRQAVKDGDILSETTAKTIVKATFALPEPYCPHGRPVWIMFSKDDLYHLVHRT